MKRNVNVFLAVVLVAMLCGGIIWLRTAKDEKLGWNIHDTYGEAPAYANSGAAYTNATFAGPSNDSDVMRMSPSRSMRHSAVSLRAGAYAISYGVTPASSPNSLITSSPLTYGGAGGSQGLYTTSSKTFNSYGGGGNGGAAMGGAMRGSSSPNSLIASSPITSISSPIAYSTARRGEMSGGAGVNPAMMAAENPVMAMTNAASAGMDNGFYGGYTAMDYSGSANYGQYSGMFGGGSRMGVRGRQNSGLTDSWLDWLYRYGYSWGNESGDENGYYYTFTEDQLRQAYEDYINNYWDPMWHPGEDKPTFEQWLDWMKQGGESGYNYNDNWYMMAPVGDILPLLLLALLYIVAMYLRSKSRTQVND